MHVEHTYLTNDFPEKSTQLQKLRQEDPSFARKADEYEALAQRISRNEELNDTTLEALKQEQAALKNDITKQLKHASGSCCGGCGG